VPVPRVLLAPTHRTALANGLAALIAEAVGRGSRQVRFHHLGAYPPAAAWDRWEGSAFLDPSLYSAADMLALYEFATRGASLSLLASDTGLFDTGGGRGWTPADVAGRLDCPVVLVADCRGWGEGFAALLTGFNERTTHLNLGGVILTGLQDADHEAVMRRAATDAGVTVLGSLSVDVDLNWEVRPPGAWGLPVPEDLVQQTVDRLSLPALEQLAGQSGFIAGRVGGREPGDGGPLVAVAGGRGFTPWSRDSIDVLRGAGARVWRLDLGSDEDLPPDTAGLVVAGSLWPDALGGFAANYGLMRRLRVLVNEGMPTLALGGGMVYFLKRVQDSLGRTFELAGILPSEGEILAELEEPAYFEVRADRETILLDRGETVTGWMATDADIMHAPVTRSFPLSVRAGTGSGWQREGAGSPSLLCSRVLMHLASAPRAAKRFVDACACFAREG
jgi:cobyrinic acid a,c-diamide synthase